MVFRVVEILWKPQELRGKPGCRAVWRSYGIEPPTQGFSIRLTYLAESSEATNVAAVTMGVDIVGARLTTFTHSQKFSFMFTRCDELGIESDHFILALYTDPLTSSCSKFFVESSVSRIAA